MKAIFLTLALCAALASCLSAQVVPDVLYYRFNEGAGTSAANSAVPGAGNPTATLYGSIGWAPAQFGSGLSGTGATGASQGVNTGYNFNLAGQSWTLEFWINLNATTSGLTYLFGVNVGGSFRCFHGAVPGTGGLFLTGSGLTSVTAAGVLANPGVWTHVAYVFDNSTTPATITPYVNAVPGAPVNQTTALTNSTVPLTIGSQLSGSPGLNGGLDEFRLWGTARTAQQIQASYNTELYPYNVFSAQTAGGGVGNLDLALTFDLARRRRGLHARHLGRDRGNRFGTDVRDLAVRRHVYRDLVPLARREPAAFRGRGPRSLPGVALLRGARGALIPRRPDVGSRGGRPRSGLELPGTLRDPAPGLVTIVVDLP